MEVGGRQQAAARSREYAAMRSDGLEWQANGPGQGVMGAEDGELGW